MRCGKRRILLVARHLVGGIRTHIAYTYGAFDPSRYSLAILATEGGEDRYLSEVLSPFDVQVHLTPKDRAVPRLALAVRRLLKSERFDIVHSHGLTAGVAACAGGAFIRIPHVVTHHGILSSSDIAGVRGQAMRRFLPILLSSVDRLVLVSEDSLQNLLSVAPGFRRLSRRGRLQVIAHGIDTAAFAAARALRLTRPSEAVSTFAFMGRFMPEKGFDTIIDAVRLLDGAPATRDAFKILCVNYGGFIHEYQAQIRRAGLGRYFEFTGLVESALEPLRRVDAVLMPSRWEAAGLLAMESLTAGCPIIVSDCVGLREVTRGTPAIVARSGDPTSLASAMLKFLEGKDTLTKAALEYGGQAERRYDGRATAVALQAAFDELLGEAGALAV